MLQGILGSEVVELKLTDIVHERFLMGRRSRVLSTRIAGLLPKYVSVLDVGCGDGDIASRIMGERPDISVQGIDVLVRPDTAIPVEHFDGSHFPFGDNTYDVVTFVDVLHHADDPAALLAEAARVARKAVVIKDHLRQGVLAGATLRFMDTVGNKRHGVALPYNYLTPMEWNEEFGGARLTVASWEERLAIYPWPATLIFDRRLHFTATLTVPEGG